MADPDVSVVVPLYNEAEHLGSLLDSLENQTLKRNAYEVVLVDNGSRDGTWERLQDYRSRASGSASVFRESSVQSSYAARNRGVQAASGSLVAFTDGDCEPAPDWLESGLRYFEETGASLVAGGIEVVFRDPLNPGVWECLDAVRHNRQEKFVRAGWGATCNLFVRSDCFERHGFFRDDLRSGGDCEFGRRVTQAGESIRYAPGAVIRHRVLNSAGELLRKEIRIGRGLGCLARDGALSWDPTSWTEWKPVTSLEPCRDAELNCPNSWLVLGAANLLHYVNVMARYGTFGSSRTSAE